MMRRSTLLLAFAMVLGLLGCGQEEAPSDAPSPPADTTLADDPMEAPPQESPGPVSFNTYLVALAPTEAEGERIGCEDVLVPVSHTANLEGTPLAAAYEALFATAATDSLDNAVAGLTVEEVTLENGIAQVRLGGSLEIGGVCDHPRIEAQLRRTALQFADVDSVAIFIDGTSLEDFLSLR